MSKRIRRIRVHGVLREYSRKMDARGLTAPERVEGEQIQVGLNFYTVVTVKAGWAYLLKLGPLE